MENKLTVRIGQADVSIKEYRGQRVVTFKEIDECHGRPEGTARRNFNTNKKHLVEGTDYFERNSSEALKEYGIVAPNGLKLITESGYLMLVKSFTDDLAWDVQRQLVNSYFRKPAADPALKLQIQQERAHAMNLNAQFRILKFFTQHAEDKHVSDFAAKVFGASALETLTGIRPGEAQCGKLYTATEIANAAHTNKNRVGRVAKANGLQTEEYGIWALSKSQYGSKQVSAFQYNAAAREKLLELLGASA